MERLGSQMEAARRVGTEVACKSGMKTQVAQARALAGLITSAIEGSEGIAIIEVKDRFIQFRWVEDREELFEAYHLLKISRDGQRKRRVPELSRLIAEGRDGIAILEVNQGLRFCWLDKSELQGKAAQLSRLP